MVVAHGLSWCEARGIFQDWMEAVSHTLVGRLSTTEPPGTPDDGLFFILKCFLLSSKYFIFRKHYLNIFTQFIRGTHQLSPESSWCPVILIHTGFVSLNLFSVVSTGIYIWWLLSFIFCQFFNREFLMIL